MDPVELLICIMVWGFQVGITLLLALFLAGLIWVAEKRGRRNRPRFFHRFLPALALVCALLAGLTVHPPVICPKELQSEFTPEFESAVRAVSSGLYSSRLPLVPAFVGITDIEEMEVEGTSEYQVSFTIQYLYFGQVWMSCMTHDGYGVIYNMEKPLN